MKPTAEDVPNELWQMACAREAVIRPLAACDRVGREDVDKAAANVGIRRAYLYRLLSAYGQRPQTSTLIPHDRGRPRETRLLDPKIESILQPGRGTA